MQACLFLFSVLVSVTRVQDHKHHPHDVIAGSILGIIVGLFVVSSLFRFFLINKKPSNFFLTLFPTREIGLQMVSVDNLENDFYQWATLAFFNDVESLSDSFDIIVYWEPIFFCLTCVKIKQRLSCFFDKRVRLRTKLIWYLF